MPRLYVPPDAMGQEAIVLSGEDHRYVCRVLRLEEGDEIVLFDGKGAEADAVLGRAGPRAVEVRVMARRQSPHGEAPSVTLLMGLPKGDRMEIVVQKATELGVAQLVPMLTDRTVLRLDEVRSTLRRQRWQKIAREAARQCGRADVPDVSPVLTLEAALEGVPREALKLFFWEEPPRRGLREHLANVERPRQIVLAVGPEGGFTYREVERARERGFAVVGLGPRILRTETAAIAALAMTGFALGDLG